MNLHLIAQKAFPKWNRYVITEREIRRVAKKKGAQIAEGKVGPLGLYTVYGGVPFIVIDPELTGVMRLWVLLHELAHHLLHVPGLQLFGMHFDTKADYEANFIAAVALLPLEVIENFTFEQLLDEGYPRELLWFRKEIYEQFSM